MLAGYADEHVKFAIVEGLRRRGMDVVTVQDRALQQAEARACSEVTRPPRAQPGNAGAMHSVRSFEA